MRGRQPSTHAVSADAITRRFWGIQTAVSLFRESRTYVPKQWHTALVKRHWPVTLWRLAWIHKFTCSSCHLIIERSSMDLGDREIDQKAQLLFLLLLGAQIAVSPKTDPKRVV